MKTAPKGQEFYFSDGFVADTVTKLAEHIRELSPQQYSTHVNADKNDFYSWIHDCINKEIAVDIKGNVAQRLVVEKLTGHVWHHEHKRKHNY